MCWLAPQLDGIKEDFHASVYQVFAYALFNNMTDNREYEHVLRTVAESVRYHALPLCLFAVSTDVGVARAFSVSTYPALVLLKEYLPENDDVEVLLLFHVFGIRIPHNAWVGWSPTFRAQWICKPSSS